MTEDFCTIQYSSLCVDFHSMLSSTESPFLRVCLRLRLSPDITTAWRPSVTTTYWMSPLDRRLLRDTKPVSVSRTHHVTLEYGDALPALLTHRLVCSITYSFTWLFVLYNPLLLLVLDDLQVL